MSRTKQNARLLDAAARDLRLHKLARPHDVSDAGKFPNIARHVADLDAMEPAKRARLEAEWAQ